ncbi:histidine phosphatase family protein [Candidatus Woesebacteria bacterium]|nr:histidine phosphatase family protein [Candidatus Woesebacteria bacterium]
MPKKIYIIRHGETDYNVERRMQGWLDIPLNETGHKQAKDAANKLVGHELHALYSSDLVRAKETATYVAKTLSIEIKHTKALRETDMGIFAGWAWEKEPDETKDKLWTEFEHARDNHILDWNAHQGESIGQMLERVTGFLSELPTLHPDQSVGIVSHGGTINRILEFYGLKESAEGFRMVGNGSIFVLTKNGNSYTIETL